MRLFYVELYEEKSYESSGQNIYINSENNKYLTQVKPKELPEYYIQNIGHKLQDLEDNNESRNGIPCNTSPSRNGSSSLVPNAWCAVSFIKC